MSRAPFSAGAAFSFLAFLGFLAVATAFLGFFLRAAASLPLLRATFTFFLGAALPGMVLYNMCGVLWRVVGRGDSGVRLRLKLRRIYRYTRKCRYSYNCRQGTYP